eukprot:Ihof_evm2s432 gene=Ihof_evmTU2s432
MSFFRVAATLVGHNNSVLSGQQKLSPLSCSSLRLAKCFIHKRANTKSVDAVAPVTPPAIVEEDEIKPIQTMTGESETEMFKQGLVTDHKTFSIHLGKLAPQTISEDVKKAFAQVGLVRFVTLYKPYVGGDFKSCIVHFAKRKEQTKALKMDFQVPLIKDAKPVVSAPMLKTRLNVWNLPEEATARLLLEKMNEWVPRADIALVEIKMKNESTCAGSAVVDFVNFRAAEKALEVFQSNDRLYMGNKLAITFTQRYVKPTKMIAIFGEDKTVLKLPVTKLENLCNQYGKVDKVIVKDYPDKSPSQVLFVRFSSIREANKAAIALNDTLISGKPITVELGMLDERYTSYGEEGPMQPRK